MTEIPQFKNVANMSRFLADDVQFYSVVTSETAFACPGWYHGPKMPKDHGPKMDKELVRFCTNGIQGKIVWQSSCDIYN